MYPSLRSRGLSIKKRNPLRPSVPAFPRWVFREQRDPNTVRLSKEMHAKRVNLREELAAVWDDLGSHGETTADTEFAKEALTKVEFHVHCDPFETPAAQYVDMFLPVTTPWEHEGIRFGFEISDEATALVQLRPHGVASGGSTLRL